MCNRSSLLKEAHKMTKDICAQYPNIDYHAQLGLCMKALYSEREQEQEVNKDMSNVIDIFDALDDTRNIITKEVNFGRHNIIVSTKVKEKGDFIAGSVVNKTTEQQFNFYWRRKNYPAPMVKIKEGNINFKKARLFLLKILPGMLREVI